MESQDKEKEYEDNIWEIYHKEWATASGEKRIELNKRMRRWQQLMKNGWTAQQAYYKAMEGELDFRVAEEPSGKQLAIPSAPRLRKAPFVILGLALVAAIVYSVIITGDRDALNTKLTSVQSALASTQSELGSTQKTLDSTKQTLASKQEELAATHEELAVTREELGRTKETLLSKQYELEEMQTELASTQSELGSIQAELEKAEASLQLYQDTLGVEVLSGVQPKATGGALVGSPNLKNNSNAENPTWVKLMVFLRADPTDDEYYSEYTFNCVSFAEMLHNNAEAKGIKAAFVGVYFRDSDIGHALNAFVTVDKGLVYVDCTGGSFTERWRYQSYSTEYDSVAYVWKGEEYGRWDINSSNIGRYQYYERFRSTGDWRGGGIVESIKIYW